MKYRVDETYRTISYGEETNTSREEFDNLEGYPVYQSSDGWSTGVEEYFDTLDEAIAYCEDMESDIAWLEYGEEIFLNEYSIVEINENEDEDEEFGTDYYFRQDYKALNRYAVVVQKCKVVGTEENRDFTDDLSDGNMFYNVYKNSVDDKILYNEFFVTLEDAQEFCENNRGDATISLNKEISCEKYSIYSVCEKVAKVEKIESEDDLDILELEEVIYPEFDCE